MKKRTHFLRCSHTRIFLIAALLGGTAAAINHMIFARAQKRLTKTAHAATYDWRYGRIRYVCVGEGEPLLLVHDTGLGCGLYEWQPLIEHLAQHYRVYALDLLGFGESEKPPLTYSAYLYTSLINDFVADVIEQPVYFAGVGHSAAFGAMARRFQPALYRKLVLISPDSSLTYARDTGRAHDTCFARVASQSRFAGKWMRHLLALPLVGTTVYNILASRFFLHEETTYNQAHFGGSGARFPIAALYGHFLHAEMELAVSAADIPVYCISLKHPQDSPQDLCGEIHECLQHK